MTPLQNNFTPFYALAGSPLGEASSGQTGAPTLSAATPSGAPGPNAGDAVKTTWYPKCGEPAPTPDPGAGHGGFFDVIAKLMDQLDAIIGQSSGNAPTVGPGDGPPAPSPPSAPERRYTA